MMGRTASGLFAMVLCGMLLASAQAAVPVYRAQTGAPAAPGTLPSDRVMTGFADVPDKPAAVQTLAAAFLGADTLTFVVECLEPNLDQLVAKCQKDDAGELFADDCVEVFISTDLAAGYYHFVTNALGARFDERGRGGVAWNGTWTARAERGSDRWTATLTLPLQLLGGRPRPGAVWWFNLCRQRQPGGLQLSSFSPTRANFHDTRRFAALTFDDACATYLAPHYLQPFDRGAAGLRARARIRSSAARQLEEGLQPAEQSLQALRAAVRSGRPLSTTDFGALLGSGQDALATLAMAQTTLDEAIAGAETAARLRQLARPGQDLLVWSTPAITDRRVLPAPEVAAPLSRELSLRACRGEFEPASFVLYPLRRTTTVEVRVSDLRGPGHGIPASAVDVRAVKCWYQAGGNERFPMNRGKHVMTPELLLRDDDLVRLDTVRKRNFVKLQHPGGRVEWLDITNPTPGPQEKDSSVAAIPIRDAAALQPVTIPARSAKQFWVTVRVPADARAGLYRGSIELVCEGKVLETVPVTLEVLPFDLAENPLESSIYFHWGLDLDIAGQGTLGIRKRTPAQLKAELINLREHGVDNPTVGVYPAKGQLAEELRLRQEAGMRNDRLYYLVAYASGLSAEQIEQIITLARGFGYREFYFYGDDEASGERLTKQRAHWEKVHAAGGKVFVAGSQGENFPRVGDLQDLLVCYGDLSREEAARWHSKGHKIFSYANPQGGIEAPETYRRNFGLLLAVNGYDGGMTYIYYSGIPSWNDYCIPPYRQHNFVYPTVDGVIDTVQWEGYREGIDDLRYLGTLRQSITRALASGGSAAAEARQAQAYLDKLNVTGDLYAVRTGLIRWILRLQRHAPAAQ